MGGGKAESDHHAEEWERSERMSFRTALAIALMPIPAALLIAWALGDLPWQHRPPRPGLEETKDAPAGHGHP